MGATFTVVSAEFIKQNTNFVSEIVNIVQCDFLSLRWLIHYRVIFVCLSAIYLPYECSIHYRAKGKFCNAICNLYSTHDCLNVQLYV